MNKKTLLIGGLTVLLTFGGLAGCGNGVDQDKPMNDDEQKDVVDNDTEKEVKDAIQETKGNLQEIRNDVENELKEKGIGDGVDQDNGITDGEKKKELDNNHP